jgi:hypothetical protein
MLSPTQPVAGDVQVAGVEGDQAHEEQQRRLGHRPGRLSGKRHKNIREMSRLAPRSCATFLPIAAMKEERETPDESRPEVAPLSSPELPTEEMLSRYGMYQSASAEAGGAPLKKTTREEVRPMPEPRDSQRERGSPGSRPEPSRPAPAEETEQLVVTMIAATGEILKIEKVDKAGKRDELSEEESAKLAGEDEVREIEAALEEAFEAGVAGALGEDDEDDEDEDDEDNEEKALRRLLIGGLLRRRPVMRRLRRRFLRRLLVRRLLRRRLFKRRLRR